MPLGIVFFGFSSKIKYVDAKIGMLFSTAALLTVQSKIQPISTLKQGTWGIKNLLVQNFYMDIKRRFSAIPNLMLGYKRMALNLTITLQVKFKLNCKLKMHKLVNNQFTYTVSEVKIILKSYYNFYISMKLRYLSKFRNENYSFLRMDLK